MVLKGAMVTELALQIETEAFEPPISTNGEF